MDQEPVEYLLSHLYLSLLSFNQVVIQDLL